jgi:hypothetical protein
MSHFSEHEIAFFKRLRAAGQKVDLEAFKISVFIIFIFTALILIPFINLIN